jgi:hypothetical protein
VSLLAVLLAIADPGTLVLGPATATTVEVRDTNGPVATVSVTPHHPVKLTLPPGDYTVVASDGTEIGMVHLDEGDARGLALPGQVVASDEAAPPVPTPTAEKPRPALATEAPAPRKPRRPRDGRWKRWGAPLLSAIVPGLGQGINAQPGKAVGIFTATVGGSLGAAALWLLRDPDEGAARNDAGESRATEIARLGGFTVLTSGLGLLYLGQIFDAHATARGRKASPLLRYTLAIEVQRSTTVGQRPGEPAYALYDDFAVSLMGQVARRVTVGVSDLGVKLAPETFTLQGGLRSMYRFFDHRVRQPRTPSRVWLAAGGGFIFQGSSRARSPTVVGADPSRPTGAEGDAELPEPERLFGAVVYAQLEGRWFLLDRWAIGLAPRISLPLTTRTYGQHKQIPRYSTTFELGAFVGVHL